MTEQALSRSLARVRLAQLWWLMLLRGLVPGALALLLFAAPALTLREAAWAVAAVVLLGSALELAVAVQLRGVMPRGSLWITGLAGLAVSGLVLSAAATTLALLLLIVGTWLGVRALTSLWMALSMEPSGGDRLLPLAMALLSGTVGVALMFWTTPALDALAGPTAAYALCHGALHAAAAWRIRAAPGRWVLAVE